MKTILILGAGVEQVYAIELAKQKGLRNVVLDMNPEAPGAAVADEFHAVSTRDIDGILTFLKSYDKKIDGVMTIASDIPHCVAAAAEFLKVPHIPLAVAQVCVDKFKMKEVLKAAGVQVPAFARVDSVEALQEFALHEGLPVVVKPVDNSGARGVQCVTRVDDLAAAFAYAKENAYSGNVIAERFVAGPQVSTEGAMSDDVFYTTAFADRNYERLEQTAPYLIEDGGDIPTELSQEAHDAVVAEFEKAVRALGINWGPAKGDMIWGDDGRAYVVEIAARLSGGNLCYDKVPWATGVDLVSIVLDLAVGNPVDASRFTPTLALASSQRYFFPKPGVIKEVRGLEEATKLPFVRKVDLWLSVGDTVPPAISHPTRVGYVISVAPTRAEAVTAVKRAVASIEFIVA